MKIPTPGFGSVLAFADMFCVFGAELLGEGGLLAKVVSLVLNSSETCGVLLDAEPPVHVEQGAAANEVGSETIESLVHVEQGTVVVEVDIEAVELPRHVRQGVADVEIDAEMVEIPAHVVQGAVFDTLKPLDAAVILTPPGAARNVEMLLRIPPLQASHAPGTEIIPETFGIEPNSPTTFGKTALKVAQASQTKSRITLGTETSSSRSNPS
ncbi:MAG: hypothetical protein M1840_004736 [Geoglossum simile]|nr:MAG: hypothetical protein M1840_004736 [Geoglossum simile]